MVAHVQTQTLIGGTGTSGSVTISSSSGNTLVVVADAYINSNTPFHITSISDSHNSWTFSSANSNQNPPVGQSYDGAYTGFMALCAVTGAAAVSGITVNFSASLTYLDLIAYEFSGVPTGSIITVAASSSTNTSASSVTTPSVIVSSGALIAVAGQTNDGNSGSNTSVSSGWTLDGGSDHCAAYKLSPSAGSLSATFTSTSSQNWPSSAILVIGPPATTSDIQQIKPGPTWFALFKPGWKRPAPLPPSSEAVETTFPSTLSVSLPTLVTSITASVVHNGPLSIVLSSPSTSISSVYENNSSIPTFQPGPTWVDIFKPGLAKPRPVTPWQQVAVEFGSLNIVIPPLLTTSITAVQTNPNDVPTFNPGPTWWALFKPGIKQTRPYTTFALKGESGQLSIALPTLATNLTAIQTNPVDAPVINPGPTWLALFKPGLIKRPPEPADRVANYITCSVVIVLSPGCRVELEQGPLNLSIPGPTMLLQGTDYYGRLNATIPTLVTSIIGQTQQTEHGALAIPLPTLTTNIVADNGRKLLPIVLVIPTLIVSLTGIVIHNGVLVIVFMPCGTHLVPLTRYEMFGCESSTDVAIGLPKPMLELSAQVVREKQPGIASWARAKQTRTARRRQLRGARAAAMERQRLREDTDDG